MNACAPGFAASSVSPRRAPRATWSPRCGREGLSRVRSRRLSEAEYRTLGGILRNAAEDERYQITADIIRQIALTGCRRSEMIKLRWDEADMEASCLRLIRALASERDDEWFDGACYLNMEALREQSKIQFPLAA